MNLSNLQTFFCSSNYLTSLPNNMILPKLQTFSCIHNQLKSLPNNMNFNNLQYFNCSYNQLSSLPVCILNFLNLQRFDCSYNQLTSLPNNMNFPNLKIFSCTHNQLTSLPDKMNFLNLQRFDCSYNQLTSLPNNMNFPNLQTFYCYNNKLTSLPICILNFRNLLEFSYYNNRIELSLQIARFIDRIQNKIQSNKIAVYTDNQNVHNSTIQLSVRDSINRITTRQDLKKYDIDQLRTLIIENTILTELSKSLLFEYINDTTVHSLLLLTFSEVLWFIIQLILTDFSNIIQEEIFKILNQEIIDADCNVLPGHLEKMPG